MYSLMCKSIVFICILLCIFTVVGCNGIQWLGESQNSIECDKYIDIQLYPHVVLIIH